MKPSERVILRVLAEELGAGTAGDAGPYGRAGVRCGVATRRVAEVEDDVVEWVPGPRPHRRAAILAVLDKSA